MEDPVVLELEVVPGTPIRGRMLDARGRERAFEGWLELTSAIQDVCSSELDRRRLDAAASPGIEDRERDAQVLDRKSR